MSDIALAVVKGRYADFGPSLACEKLAEVHGWSVSRGTPRKWMIAGGFWADRSRRMVRVHQPRDRRAALGI